MIEIANARINSFGTTSPKADFVPTSEEKLVTVPASLLQAFQDRIDALEDRIITQDEKIAALEATQDTQAENELNMLRLINDLRKRDPGKMEISRAEKIEKYLQARPDHKASFETLKGHLQVNNARLNEAIKILVATSGHSYSIQKEKTGDKRKRILVMLSI